MGVVNITPDSFSDGGRCLDPQDAIEHGLRLLEQGADLLDLGAESTRPGGGVYGEGARPVSVAEELDRLLPVLETLRGATEAPLSVDTRKAAVAAAALAAGADLINDIGALADPAMQMAAARSGAPVVLMHSRGELGAMQRDISFTDVVAEVRAELETALGRAVAAGVGRERIFIDPGIGFGKTAANNLELLARLDELGDLAPVLVGASRKSFIGEVTGAAVGERLAGSLAAVAWAARHGVAIVRVHDVAETRQFLDLWRAVQNSRSAAS
jgi:dihydropteroate synthase